MSFNASDRSVELLSLGKYTVYDIGVLAINIKGDGNISRTSCRTSEDGICLFVCLLSIHNKN